jgi:glutamate-1-semialdehyde 2,1-aminomutase
VPLSFNRIGSMFTWFFNPCPVTDWSSASKSDTAAFGRFYRAMIESGIYLPPSQFEAAFLSTTHSDEDISRTIEAAKQAFASMKA